jgi:hypothetical protein
LGLTISRVPVPDIVHILPRTRTVTLFPLRHPILRVRDPRHLPSPIIRIMPPHYHPSSQHSDSSPNHYNTRNIILVSHSNSTHLVHPWGIPLMGLHRRLVIGPMAPTRIPIIPSTSTTSCTMIILERIFIDKNRRTSSKQQQLAQPHPYRNPVHEAVGRRW